MNIFKWWGDAIAEGIESGELSFKGIFKFYLCQPDIPWWGRIIMAFYFVALLLIMIIGACSMAGLISIVDIIY